MFLNNINVIVPLGKRMNVLLLLNGFLVAGLLVAFGLLLGIYLKMPELKIKKGVKWSIMLCFLLTVILFANLLQMTSNEQVMLEWIKQVLGICALIVFFRIFFMLKNQLSLISA
jgi:hypothetical protein